MLAAFRPFQVDPDLSLHYRRGWNIEECDEQHPDYGKVLIWVRTKKEAKAIVDRQEIPKKEESV